MLAKFKLFLSGLESPLLDIWNRSKIFLLAVGAAIVYLEWQKIKTAFLTLAAQKEMKSDDKQDQALSTQEDNNNKQADALVQQAQALPAQEPAVTDDWYEKDGK